MSREEAFTINKKGLCWIAFYYGRVECGYLYFDFSRGNWYFIRDIKLFNQRERNIELEIAKGNAELVSLDMIRSCEGPLPKLQDGEDQVTVTDYDETILVVLEQARAMILAMPRNKEGLDYL